MYEIEFTSEAVEDLRSFKKRDRQLITDEVERQLKREPTQETRNRKRLRPNRLAEWELRVDKFRVFYDVEAAAQVVKISAVGYKEGNRLFIGGEEFEL